MRLKLCANSLLHKRRVTQVADTSDRNDGKQTIFRII